MRAKWRVSRFALVLLAGAGVVGACGGAGVSGDDPRIIIHDFEGGMDMEITGTVTYDPERNCLFLRHDDPIEPEEFTTPLWPSGTKPVVHDGKRGVQVPGQGRFVEGDALSAGGGGVSRDSVEHLGIPAECIAEGGIRVINF